MVNKKELEKKIINCSKCQYWKNSKIGPMFGEKTCKQHERQLAQLEDETKETVGFEVRAIVENSKINVVKELNNKWELYTKLNQKI